MKHYYSNPLGLLVKAIKYRSLFKSIERYGRDQLKSYQLQKIRTVVKYAYEHVPYYRSAYAGVGCEPGDIKTFDDFEKLPFLTKDKLREEDPKLFLSDELGRLGVAYLKTSGSTGVPLQFACDLESRAAKYAITMMAFEEAGYRLGAGQFILKNCFYADRAFSYSWLTNRISMHAYMNSKANCLACEKLLCKHSVRHILAHPNALVEFGSSLHDVRGAFRKLRGITTMSEPLTPALRSQIEDLFGVKVFDYYSNKESSLIAYETRDRGYVLGEQFSYNEFVPIADGQNEIVSTTFYSRAMPLIRYRNSDIVKLHSDNQSGAFRQVQEVSGRISEAIVLPDGNKVRIFNFMHSGMENVRMYQIVQTDPYNLRIDVVPIDKGKAIRAGGLAAELKSYVGDGVRITVKMVAELKKTTAGKTPRIVSDM